MNPSKLLIGLLSTLSILFAASQKDLDYLVIAKEMPVETFTYDEAQEYCNALTLYGLSDWQLPNAKELHALSSSTKQRGAKGAEGYLDKEILDLATKENTLSFWSSATFETTSVDFTTPPQKRVNGFEEERSTLHQLICVHQKPTPRVCYQFKGDDFNETIPKSEDLIIEMSELLYDTRDDYSAHLTLTSKNISNICDGISFSCERLSGKSLFGCTGYDGDGEIELKVEKDALALHVTSLGIAPLKDESINYSIQSKKSAFSKGKKVACLGLNTKWKEVVYKRTPEDDLFNAASAGDARGVIAALEKDANIDAIDNRGFTPLFAAIDHFEIVKLLINYDADIHFKNEFYGTLMGIAIEKESLRTVQFLIDNGHKASLESIFSDIDKDGNFELESLYAQGDQNMVTLLVNNGANIDIKDDKGYTPIFKAVIAKDMPMLELFVLYHAKLDTVYENNQTLLSKACGDKWVEGCELLSKKVKK